VATLYESSFKDGFGVQDQFIEAMMAQEYEVRRADVYDDRMLHIDVWIRIDGLTYGVDVKSLKRLSRSWEQQYRYTCLELHGVHQNNRGWLHGGADLIAFEQESSFVLVWRDRLIDIVAFMVSPERVDASYKAIYKVYSRRDHEEITWIETSLIRNQWVLFREIPKCEEME
jgi:hypothetical protein